jgi:hypothetical protein
MDQERAATTGNIPHGIDAVNTLEALLAALLCGYHAELQRSLPTPADVPSESECWEHGNCPPGFGG